MNDKMCARWPQDCGSDCEYMNSSGTKACTWKEEKGGRGTTLVVFLLGAVIGLAGLVVFLLASGG